MNCYLDFSEGQTYRVYARGNKDSLKTDKCTRTRPISEATEDIRYPENAADGHPQGLLYGLVFRRMTVSGNLSLYPPQERLQLVAAGQDNKRSIDADEWGSFQLVFGPGAYEVWVERAGESLILPRKIRVVNGDAQRLAFQVEYQ